MKISDEQTVGLDIARFRDLELDLAVDQDCRALLLCFGQRGQATLRLQVSLGYNAHIHIVQIFRRISDLESRLVINLNGRRSSAFVSGVYQGRRQDVHRSAITMHHRTRDTKGDIMIKGVYHDSARAAISGLLKIDKTAQQTDSYFHDDVLLLDKAKAVSEPQLEIRANDVSASHGATTGRIDQEKVYYLQTRGLSEIQARQLIIDGFFQPIMERLPTNF